MKIKKSSSKKKLLLQFALPTFGIVACCLLLFSWKSNDLNVLNSKKPKDPFENPTELYSNKIDFKALKEQKKGILYKDGDVSIHLVTQVGIPKIVFLYDNLRGRKGSDRFFMHLYLKDRSKFKSSEGFLNLDFVQKPQATIIDNKKVFVFMRTLESDLYDAPFIETSNITHINMGRFKSGEGRSLDLKKVQIPKSLKELQVDIPKVVLQVSNEHFSKIKVKREAALKRGVLITSDDDLVPGTLALDNQNPVRVDFRLKGDWTDHLGHPRKWSFRIIAKGDKTVRGMRKFSIQNPISRQLLWEWLFNKAIKDQGLIGLRYDFVHLTLNVSKAQEDQQIPVGLMAWEEAFDKILIENNQKREGLILAFDESLYWSDQEREKHFKLDHNTYSKKLRDVSSAPIKVFNQGKVMADPNLSNQLSTASALVEGLRQGDYKISEVFDLDKLTTFMALTNLFGGHHGLAWHNLRIYYNPITNKLEPISFDSNSGVKIDKIHHYLFYEDDPEYDTALLQKLKWVSHPDFINTFMSKYQDQLQALKLTFLSEYPNPIDESVLEYNANVIKKIINPGTLITSHLIDVDDSSLTVDIYNLTDYKVVVNALGHEDGRILSAALFNAITIDTGAVHRVRFPLNDYFINAFVSKKNKKGEFQIHKDYKKLRIDHSIEGIDIERSSSLYPLPRNPDYSQTASQYREQYIANYTRNEFIEKQGDTLLFQSGSYTLDKNLVIPSGLHIKIQPGFQLDFKQGASLIAKSTFSAKGTPQDSIRFFSSDASGGGLFITNAAQKSVLRYCIFDNLSNPHSTIWSVSGAVNFHESDVDITHSVFKNNRCEDGLNIIRSQFTMTDTVFENTQSDAFDGDFVEGTITDTQFINSGNDGIDISGSQLEVNNVVVTNSSDKGISAGENSRIQGQHITIQGGEIGVVSKDLSSVIISDLKIIDTRLGLSAFQKKSEYGVAAIKIDRLLLKNAERDYLIERNSQLIIDGNTVETVTNKVIDQMYGKEYGKSSR